MQDKKYDLEDRTLSFSKNCIDLCRLFMRDAINIELVSQLVRASTSVGANYREANDSITRKGFHNQERFLSSCGYLARRSQGKQVLVRTIVAF